MTLFLVLFLRLTTSVIITKIHELNRACKTVTRSPYSLTNRNLVAMTKGYFYPGN